MPSGVPSTPRIPGPAALPGDGDLFRLLVEHSRDLVGIIGRDGGLVYANPAAQTLLGRDPAAMGRAGWLELVHPDDRERVRDAFLYRIDRSGTGTPTLLRLRTGSGEWRHVEAIGSVLDGHDAMIVNARDVTDRYTAEQSVREAEARFRALVDNALDVITVLDPDGTIRYGSPSGERVLGYGHRELKGRQIHSLVHPLDRPAISTLLQQAIREPDTPQEPHQLRVRHADGSWRVFDVIGRNLLHDPAVRGFLVNAHDVTDRIRAEERLQASERRYRSLFEFNPNAVYGIELDGRIAAVNPACCELLGYPADVLQTMRFVDVVDPHDHARAMAIFDKVLAGEPTNYTLVVRHQSGRAIEISGISVPILLEGGAIGGVFGIAEDVTDRNALEKQLRHSQKLEAVGRLAGGVAHDFNNLLTAINGHAELILSELPDNHPQRLDAEEIARAAVRAANLTRQLLAFSRKQILQPCVLDLNGVVRDIDRLLRRLIGEDIHLTLSLDPDLERVKADPSQVEQVIVNLAINARDAMPGGGVLIVETSVLELQGRVRFGRDAVPAGRYVRLAVCDTGSGMVAEVAEHVFEPFFTTKEQGKGTGLGLATVYGIVKQSGGYIYADSEPGAGSTFTVLLPAVEAEGEEARPAHPGRRTGAGGTETVLLVEDERSVREFARRVLQRHGYTVLEATNGPEALLALDWHKEPIHLLLSDVVMPGLGGRELAEAVVARRPGVRILFMSGYTEDEVLRRGVSESLDRFLAKPFSPAELTHAVRSALDAPSARPG